MTLTTGDMCRGIDPTLVGAKGDDMQATRAKLQRWRKAGWLDGDMFGKQTFWPDWCLRMAKLLTAEGFPTDPLKTPLKRRIYDRIAEHLRSDPTYEWFVVLDTDKVVALHSPEDVLLFVKGETFSSVIYLPA